MSPDGSSTRAGRSSDAPLTSSVPVTFAAAAKFAGWSAAGLAALLAVGTLLGIAAAGTTAGSGSPWALDWLGADAAGGSGSGAMAAILAALRTGLLFVGEIGAQVAGLVLPVAVVWLVLRRAWAPALYAAVTGLGTVVLAMAIQPLIGLFTATGLSTNGTFPDAVALGITVASGAFLLTFLPVIAPRRRALALVLAVVVVLAIGLSVIALKPATVSVLAGWVLGILWLGVTALCFRRYRTGQGLPHVRLRDGLIPEDASRLSPAPAQDGPVAAASRPAAKLAGVAVVLAAVLIGAGLLITEVLASVRRFDQAVIEWFASIHTPALSALATFIGELGNTAGVIAVLLVVIPLSLAITRRWTPAVFLTVLPVGETALYLSVSSIVGRSRPVLEQASELPPTASFPSGHTAASMVTYGGIALLLVAWSRGRWRYAAVPVAALIVLGVALSRVYDGVHYPTDTLFSVLFALVWLAVCWRIFRPDRGAPLNRPVPDGARRAGSAR